MGEIILTPRYGGEFYAVYYNLVTKQFRKIDIEGYKSPGGVIVSWDSVQKRGLSKIGRLGARRKGSAASKPKSGYLLGHQLIARIMLLNGTEPIFYRIISVVLKLTGKYLGSVKKTLFEK